MIYRDRVDTELSGSWVFKALQKTLFWFLALLLFMGAGLWLLSRAGGIEALGILEFFRIKNIEVNTHWPLSKDKIQKNLEILKAKTLFTVSLDSLAKDLKKDPWVGEVLLQRKMPNALYVEALPKTAVAILRTPQQMHFLDSSANVIDVLRPETSPLLNLPFISFEQNIDLLHWSMTDLVFFLKSLQSELGAQLKVSEIVLSSFPFFRVYLVDPKIEIVFDWESAYSQTRHLKLLLEKSELDVAALSRMDLVSPKKAVVRSKISK